MNRLTIVTALVLALVPFAAGASETGVWDWYTDEGVLSQPSLLLRPHSLLYPPHMYLAVKPGLGLKTVDYSIDADSGIVKRTASVMGVDVEPPVTVPLSQYATLIGRYRYAQMWKVESRRGVRDLSEAGRAGGLFSIDLPIKFPRAVQAVVGKGKPNLRVTGSETISFSGNSSWTVGQKYSEYGRQSKFPRLDMKQDLVVKLDGTIGDKIDVDWDQSSAATTSLANRIRIKYHGYDDEVIQSVDLGNTNLSIPNTQYVSYSGTHEGLFGIKTVAKLGSVDLAVIASKQEGKPDKQRITGGAKLVQKQISDLDNKRRTYFFLDPPDFAHDRSIVIDPASVQVYIDDLNGYNNESGTIKGKRAYLYKPDGTRDTTYFEGNFDVKEPNVDYTFEYFYGSYYPILVLRGGLPANYVLAVTYREVVNGQDYWVGNPSPQDLELKMIAAPVDEQEADVTTGRWGPLARYELKNLYYLGSEAIISESLKLYIKKRSGGAGVDEDALNGIPYIQILGLDTRGQLPGSPPDGQIDEGQFLDLTNGILVFPDLHPFAPDSFDITSWVLGPRPDTLRGDETNPNIYTKKSLNYYLDTRYYLDVEYRSPQTTFSLGWNILENSEVVTLNGVTLQRGVAYTIDYDTGELVLLTEDALQPNAEVTVDFSRASALGLSKTLLGFSTQYKPTEDLSFGTTWLYESKGTTEERPRLEQEPSRTIVGGLSTSMKFSPTFMTSLVDALPLVRTRERSSLNISGEMGLSIPNPNTRDEVYIDDMEGNKETRPLGLSRVQWKPSSVPEELLPTVVPSGKRPLWWYNLSPTFNPSNVVHVGDLYPERTAEEREQALTGAMELYFNQTQGAHGLTQAFSLLGEDFTEMQYVEVWVNDFGAGRDQTKKIRLDLGVVSEDAAWAPDSLPNGRLDTEDTSPPNGELDISPVDEDTGLDEKMNSQETCIPGVTGDPPDCSQDDYRYDPETAPNDFSHINGTEGNRMAMAHPIPDTEDLDGDGTLDVREDYVEYVVTMEQDSRFQVRDNGNGWRLFRIPLSDTLAVRVGLPRWDNVKHARLWFDGFQEGEKLQVADIEIVGNKWVLTPISNAASYAEGERFYVGVINNKDNGNIYYPPPIEIGEQNGIPNREQSLVLSAKNVFAPDTVSAFKAFAGGSDYTQYKTLKFWLRGDSDSLVYFIRIGTDSLNYYEYATTVQSFWQLKEFALEDLSILKQGLSSSVVDTTVRNADGWLGLKGRPSFTSVKRITMGLMNVASRTDSSMVATDSVWVDELILTGVKKDIGMAKRVFVETKFADLLSLTTQMESRDQDFLSIGSTRGSGNRTETYSVSGSMALHKFIPGGQFNIPVTFSLTSRKDIPKFQSGNDIVLTKDLEEVQTSKGGTSTLGVSFRKSASPNKWLRYSLEAIGIGFSITKTHSSNVSSVDSTRTLAGSFSYSFSPPAKSSLGIPFGKGKKLSLSLLPSSLLFTARGTSSRSKSYSRDSEDPFTLIPRSDVRRRVGDFSAQASYAPISILKCSYSINTSRDWQIYNASRAFGNIGTEVTRNQNFRADLTPKLGNWLTPSVSFNGSYSEDHRPELTRADDVSEIRNFSNSGAINFGLAVPLSRLAQVFMGSGGGAPRDSAAPAPDNSLRPLGLLLGKIGDIRASHSISYGSGYSRMYGKPNFSYMLGLRRAYGGNARFADDGVATSSIGNTTSLAASGRLLRGITLDGRFETTDREVESLTGVRVEKKTTWPELKLGWAGIEKQLGFAATVTSLRLDSSFRRTVEESGAKGKPSEKVVRKNDWQPLLNITAAWKNGMRTSYSSSFSTTETESYVGSGYTSKTTSTHHSFSLQKTVDATKGISLPFASGKKFKLKSSVNLGLSVQYSSVSSTIPPQVSQKTDDLSVTSTATYSFSTNLSGSFNFGFTQNRDLQIGVTRRGMTVGLSASFRF